MQVRLARDRRAADRRIAADHGFGGGPARRGERADRGAASGGRCRRPASGKRPAPGRPPRHCALCAACSAGLLAGGPAGLVVHRIAGAAPAATRRPRRSGRHGRITRRPSPAPRRVPPDPSPPVQRRTEPRRRPGPMLQSARTAAGWVPAFAGMRPTGRRGPFHVTANKTVGPVLCTAARPIFLERIDANRTARRSARP